VDGLLRDHPLVGAGEIAASLEGLGPLPDGAAALTFDDGLRDHAAHVFPLLRERGIQGLFYVPARALLGREVLRVHRIHLLLARCGGEALLRGVLERCRELGPAFDAAALEARYVHTKRFDDRTTGLVKWILTSALPAADADRITGELLREHHPDEAAVAARLYLSLAEAREMAAQGMHFGGHGDGHVRLDELPEEAQAREIDASLEMIGAIHGPGEPRTFAYPYGPFTDATVSLLERRGFRLAWATRDGLAASRPGARYRLRRVDANDVVPGTAMPAAGGGAARVDR
jgi:peptidoglycan/xylan/chitin deacetylase (PgdA/CDA1 family)